MASLPLKLTTTLEKTLNCLRTSIRYSHRISEEEFKLQKKNAAMKETCKSLTRKPTRSILLRLLRLQKKRGK